MPALLVWRLTKLITLITVAPQAAGSGPEAQAAYAKT